MRCDFENGAYKNDLYPSKNMTSKQHRFDVDAYTLFYDCVPAGISPATDPTLINVFPN